MNVLNKTELKLEGYTKCSLFCDSDCPLGQLYDYISTVKSFVFEKIKEAEQAQKNQECEKVEPI